MAQRKRDGYVTYLMNLDRVRRGGKTAPAPLKRGSKPGVWIRVKILMNKIFEK